MGGSSGKCHPVPIYVTVAINPVNCSRYCLGQFQIAKGNEVAEKGGKASPGKLMQESRERVMQSNEGNADGHTEEKLNPYASAFFASGDATNVNNQPSQKDDDTQYFRRIRVICIDIPQGL